MTDMTRTPSRLWKSMTPEQRRRAASALWAEPEATSDHRQAALLIAKHMKFRPKTVMGLDEDRKTRYLASVPDPSEDLAARLLVVYHLAAQRPLMGAFLDALGITHDHGLIQEATVTPDPTKMAAAVTAIVGAYPAPDVALYLNTLLWQDPTAWAALRELPEAVRAARTDES